MHDQLSDTVQSLLRQQPLLGNAYFESLRNGSMSLTGFQRSQLQFFFAVRFFSRPMAALAARLPDSRSRMTLIHNLAEEHGEFNASQAHDRTFAQFLESIGVDSQTLAETQEGPEVRAFNLALLGTCTMAEPELAFGCLGIIEHTFAEISALIGQVVTNRDWVKKEDLVHYKLHSELDVRHAAEFFHEVEPAWRKGGLPRDRVEEGLRLGHYLFDRLYSDLYRIAQP